MNVTTRLHRMRRIANLMDAQFSFFGFRFGLDSIIGLVPGAGDIIGGAISLYLVWQAHLLGVPRSLIEKMLFNVALDVIIGSIPVLGDIYDFFFKSNRRNVKLVEKWLDAGNATSTRAL